jgi:hypothetical protein
MALDPTTTTAASAPAASRVARKIWSASIGAMVEKPCGCVNGVGSM